MADRAQGARGLLAAEESDRSRLARELHDELGQLLTLALLQVDSGAGPQELRATLEAAHASARAIAFELRPGALDDLGLAAALHALADVRAEEGALDDLDPLTAATIFRIVQEARGDADAVAVTAARTDDALILEVTGVGLEPTEAMRARALAIGATLSTSGGGTDIALRLPADGMGVVTHAESDPPD